MSVYVVVADSSRARILSGEAGSGPLIEKNDLVHPESRLRQQDIVSDASGSEAGGFGHHSMGHEKSAKDQAAHDFARQVVAQIESIQRSGDLGRLYLVAAPRFLGMLREHLGKTCRELVSGEVDKDLVQHGLDDIRSHLPRNL